MCIISEQIYEKAMKATIPCLQGKESVLRAVELMDMHEVNIIGVECEDRFLGVFRRRDFLKKVVKRNLNPEYIPLCEAVELNPPAVNCDATIKETYEAMLACRCEYMPILKGRKLCGIVSLRDLGMDVMRSLEEVKMENEIIKCYIRGGESYVMAVYKN